VAFEGEEDGLHLGLEEAPLEFIAEGKRKGPFDEDFIPFASGLEAEAGAKIEVFVSFRIIEVGGLGVPIVGTEVAPIAGCKVPAVSAKEGPFADVGLKTGNLRDGKWDSGGCAYEAADGGVRIAAVGGKEGEERGNEEEKLFLH